MPITIDLRENAMVKALIATIFEISEQEVLAILEAAE